MNKQEAIELFLYINQRCTLEESDRVDRLVMAIRPNRITSKGYSLFIDSIIVDENSSKCINQIAQERNLLICRTLCGATSGFEIYSP